MGKGFIWVEFIDKRNSGLSLENIGWFLSQNLLGTQQILLSK
tara:strand:- start:2605 stop:2730 length:126 start_codon:yes stop_codon:yes gene_type:complete